MSRGALLEMRSAFPADRIVNGDEAGMLDHRLKVARMRFNQSQSSYVQAQIVADFTRRSFELTEILKRQERGLVQVVVSSRKYNLELANFHIGSVSSILECLQSRYIYFTINTISFVYTVQ